jgi:nicotinamidase-related amidase
MKRKMTIFAVSLFLFSIILLTRYKSAATDDSGKLASNASRKLVFTERSRSETREYSNEFVVVEKTAEWDPKQTACIIIDMWDRHWCESATARVAEMAPAINRFASVMRDKGVMIVHAPSEVVEYYKGTPARERARNAPKAANLPAGIGAWCDRISERETLSKWPIDESGGGCDGVYDKVDERVWKCQTPAIDIKDEDAISDSGVEIWNLFEQLGIKNVMIAGVHTNVCVVGRPFGLRNMARFGKNTVLVRDLTDGMFDPAKPPYVDHFTGVDLVIEHIEKYICPTTTSASIAGLPEFHFKEDRRVKSK